jgi:hypothetical protein
MVVLTCNPSYTGGGRQEDEELESAKLVRLSNKPNKKAKDWRYDSSHRASVPHLLGPGFHL